MYRIKGKFKKTNDLKYISHLDTLRLFQRAIRRAEIPLKYSEGYNPHPKIGFASPLALGIESVGEYFEMELREKIKASEFINKLNAVLPKDSHISNAVYFEENDKDSLMKKAEWSEYLVTAEILEPCKDEELINIASDIINEGRTILRTRKKKKKIVQKEIDTKGLLKFLSIRNIDENKIIIETILRTSNTGSLKIDELINILSDDGMKIGYYKPTRNNILDESLVPLIKTEN